MILVIPAIEIRQGKCACVVQSLPENPKTYPNDPIEMARLWRKENAKVLYLVDLDGKDSGKPENWEVIENIVNVVDIPVVVSGGFRSYEDVKKAIDIGILRIVLDMEICDGDFQLKELINEFGSKRIALNVEVKGNVDAVKFALRAKENGIERIVYKDVFEDETVNFISLENFAKSVGLKITAFGELAGYPDLKKLSEMERYGVDSVVLSKSLYQNRFPCQYLWRIVEAEIL